MKFNAVTPRLKSMSEENDYTVSFRDSTGKFAPSAWHCNIPTGSHEKINHMLDWRYRCTVNDALDDTRFTWKDSGGDTLQSGVDSVTLQIDTAAKPVSVSAILELVGYGNDTVRFLQVQPGPTIRHAMQYPVYRLILHPEPSIIGSHYPHKHSHHQQYNDH
ncbi:MAG: hypothetical protein V5A59_10165 [Bacteroidales bacterium]